MGSATCVTALSLAASFIICGPFTIQAFPISRVPVVANNYRCRVKHINTLPPSINDEVDTQDQNKEAPNGQMDSLRQTLFAELEKMRNQFTEMSEMLNVAKVREEKAQGNVASLKEQQRSAESEKKKAIEAKKSEFVQEMTDLSDELEESQDKLRQTILKTKSEITDIQTQAKETEGRLRSEIADLESRLNMLREEAASAAKARDLATKQTRDEIDDIKSASRKLMREAKANAFEDRKAIRRDNYAQESRIQQAEMDLIPAEREAEAAELETPKISFLQGALDSMKKRMEPQVSEMKERRSANEMFFVANKKSMKLRFDDEMARAKEEFETAQSIEQGNLQQTISSYETKLENKEKQLLKKLRLSNEKADRAVADAISTAKNNRIALYEEKFNAVRKQEEEKSAAMKEAIATQKSVRDQYDAELENEIINLEQEKVRAKRRLEEQEQFREEQNRKLLEQIDQLRIQLDQQIKDERAAADEDLRVLKAAKGVELDNSKARTKKALNDIQVARSNLVLLQEMVDELEVTDERKSIVLQGLEEERSSFRKQVKRTAVVAWDKLTLKDYRSKRAKRKEQ